MTREGVQETGNTFVSRTLMYVCLFLAQVMFCTTCCTFTLFTLFQVRFFVMWAPPGWHILSKTIAQPSSFDSRSLDCLRQLRGHDNIVGMLGLCGTTVVTEYVPISFKTAAFRHGKELPRGKELSRGKVLPLERVVSLALDAAKGLQALHETAGAIFVDMKPHMLLIDGTGRGETRSESDCSLLVARTALFLGSLSRLFLSFIGSVSRRPGMIANGLGNVHLMSTNPAGHGGFCKAQVSKPRRVVPWRAPENVAGEVRARNLRPFAWRRCLDLLNARARTCFEPCPGGWGPTLGCRATHFYLSMG